MHPLSLATAEVIRRRLQQATGEDWNMADLREIAVFVEKGRVRLSLDNATQAAIMFFVKSLVRRWSPHWCFAYAISLSLAAKHTLEGFQLSEVQKFVTKDLFSMQHLAAGERAALEALSVDLTPHQLRRY